MRSKTWQFMPFVLVLPIIVIVGTLLLVPLSLVVHESLRPYEAGAIGAAEEGNITLQNYAELLSTVYLKYFANTFYLSAIASALSVVLAYPISYSVARESSRFRRKIYLVMLICVLFQSGIVRVYAILLTLNSFNLPAFLGSLLGVGANSLMIVKASVVLGLMSYLVPLVALMLIAPIQNINPRLHEAAVTLGAPSTFAHIDTTLRLSMNAVVSAFLLGFTLSVSAFMIPLVLGKGRVLFISNLVYARFAEVANYPNGAAIAIVLLVLSALSIFLVSGLSPSSRATK